MTIRPSIRDPRLHSSTQQLTSRGRSSTPIHSHLDEGQGVLTMPQVLRSLANGALESQVPSSSYTWDTASLNKPSECHQRPWTSSRRSGRFQSDLPSDQGESDHETAIRTPLPLARTHAVEPLPPPIPSPPWSRVRQKALVLGGTPTSHTLDKHLCRYDFSPSPKGAKWTTRPFFEPQGKGEYSDEDSEFEGSSSRFKNARNDAIALAQFRQIVESHQVVDHSSSDMNDNDPCSRVSTPEGYPEALRNRSKRPRSKSWGHAPLPRAKRKRPWVSTVVDLVVNRADSDIEMADPTQREIRPSPASSCYIQMNCIMLSSTAHSGHFSDPVVLSPPQADRPDSDPEALDSSQRLHCSVPGCTASYHSLWAYDRHRANHQVSLPSPTLAMNCTKCGTGAKRFESSDSHVNTKGLIWCSFGCQLSFSHVWKKELHDDRIHKGKAFEPSMCWECGSKPTDPAEMLQKKSSQKNLSTPLEIPSIYSAEPFGTTEGSNKISETTMLPLVSSTNPEDLPFRLSTSSRRIPCNRPLAVSSTSPTQAEPPTMTSTIFSPHNPEDGGAQRTGNITQPARLPGARQTPLVFVQVQPMIKSTKSKFRHTIMTGDGKRQTFAT